MFSKFIQFLICLSLIGLLSVVSIASAQADDSVSIYKKEIKTLNSLQNFNAPENAAYHSIQKRMGILTSVLGKLKVSLTVASQSGDRELAEDIITTRLVINERLFELENEAYDLELESLMNQTTGSQSTKKE